MSQRYIRSTFCRGAQKGGKKFIPFLLPLLQCCHPHSLPFQVLIARPRPRPRARARPRPRPRPPRPRPRPRPP
eukprot:766562-Hanusia_phi.AAC.1